MVNMRMLIRILFVIFIANGIDSLGGVCDNCCEYLKEKKNKNEEINKDKEKEDEKKEDENITAESLVNDNWYNAKKENLILKIFKKKDDNDIFTSTENEDKISIKLAENDNSKIEYLQENEDKLKLNNQKYALFEIKTNTNKTVYLYCSDVENSKVKINEYVNKFFGIFEETDHISISVIACDTENVRNMAWMFYRCSSLKNLDIKNLNTTNIIDMKYMFYGCSSLEELDLKNFNTTSVTEMRNMFSGCSSLKKLDLNNFDTTKVLNNMNKMFYNCNNLTDLKFGDNFNITKVTDVEYMFNGCSSFPEKIKNNLNNVKGIINYFKGGKIF